jgi:hypothetical protein
MLGGSCYGRVHVVTGFPLSSVSCYVIFTFFKPSCSSAAPATMEALTNVNVVKHFWPFPKILW